jgi:hypothetical protein
MTAGYLFGPARVDVETDTADAGLWLAEFLTPWVDAVPFGRGQTLVRLTCSDAAVDFLDHVESAADVRLLPCFALDTQFVALPAWDDGGSTVLVDEDLECVYRVSGSRIDVVSRPGGRRPRLGLMRVVREVLTATALARGQLLDIHGAAFEVGNRAVLIAGPKDVGKTTMLCHALASGLARMIANDRVLVDVDGRPREVLGVPTIVSVRPDTLRFFPQLRLGPHERPLLVHTGERESEVEGAAGVSPPRRPARDFSLSPAQLARRLGSAGVPGAPLSVIVIPEISGEVATWTLDRLPASEGLARLGEVLYGTRRRGCRGTVLANLCGPATSRPDPAALAERLAEGVRFFRCRLGPQAFQDGAEGWLRALGLDGAGDRPLA